MRDIIPKEERLIQDLKGKSLEVSEIEERLEEANRLGINIGLLEGSLLRFLVAHDSVEKVVEIGSQFGCSATYMAQAIGNKGEIYLLEHEENCLKELQKAFFVKEKCKFECKVEILPGKALESLKTLELKGPFDLVFIDADKGGYLDYYHWARENLKVGGYLVADNVFLFDALFEDIAPKGVSKKSFLAMKSFMKEFFADPMFESSLMPSKEGLALGLKIQ